MKANKQSKTAPTESTQAAPSAFLNPARKFSLDSDSRKRGEVHTVNLSVLADSVLAETDSRIAQVGVFAAAVVKVQGIWRRSQTRKTDSLSVEQATRNAELATLETLGLSNRGSGGAAGQAREEMTAEEQTVIDRFNARTADIRKARKATA